MGGVECRGEAFNCGSCHILPHGQDMEFGSARLLPAIDKMCFNSFLMDFIRHLMHTHPLPHPRSTWPWQLRSEKGEHVGSLQRLMINAGAGHGRIRPRPTHSHTRSDNMRFGARHRGVSIKILLPLQPAAVQMLWLLLLTEPSNSDRRTPTSTSHILILLLVQSESFRRRTGNATKHLPCMKLFNKN